MPLRRKQIGQVHGNLNLKDAKIVNFYIPHLDISVMVEKLS